MVRSFDTLNILGLLFDVSKNGTEKSCNDSENMFALFYLVVKAFSKDSIRLMYHKIMYQWIVKEIAFFNYVLMDC